MYPVVLCEYLLFIMFLPKKSNTLNGGGVNILYHIILFNIIYDYLFYVNALILQNKFIFVSLYK